MGNVPIRMASICTRPQGSQRDGSKEVTCGKGCVALWAHPSCKLELVGELFLYSLSHRHEVCSACTNNDHLHLSVLKHFGQSFQQEVVSLLGVQAANKDHQWPLTLWQARCFKICSLELGLGS